jgi:deoxyribodipyrimidine photolyase
MLDKALLESLDLADSLKHRVLCRVPPTIVESSSNDDRKKKSFVLYLPTVLLRKRHNPAFAFACYLANHYHLPVIVLCTVLDDHHLSQPPLSPTAMTARRLAFTLEALQSCCRELEEHGAGVAIRVHGPGARTLHHLSLSHHAAAVVSDEPFVDPYRQYLRQVVKTCQSAKVPCFTVDGSTTVPPNSKLQLNKIQRVQGDLAFTGAPAKAWRWEQLTNPDRKSHVYAAVRYGALDAPELVCKLPPNFFLESHRESESCHYQKDSIATVLNAIPSKWQNASVPCPGQRPWTVGELLSISNCKEWAMHSCEGADTSVPPCRQTHGSVASANRRWQSFREKGLKNYAKRRNQIVHPRAVSRISCYLNLGILSIFDVIYDVWQAKNKPGYSTGCDKFLDEVVKWREGSYVHTFANPQYHAVDVLPTWSRSFLERLKMTPISASMPQSSAFTYETLESAATGDEVWDAMQGYLVETGELHNNARMSW